MHKPVLTALLLLLTCVGCTTGPVADTAEDLPINARFNPIAVDMEGWTVYVEPALLPGGEHAEDGAEALEMLANHLQRITVLMNEPQLTELRKVGIWIEVDNPLTDVEPGPYHPGAEWLLENGYDPRMEGCVHITRAASLLERHHMLKHPMVILHELAHAYHDQVRGFDDARIEQVYEQAMADGLYDEVMDYTGQRVPAYAATNRMEYFAEATEAYFYRNDFYPFLRTELVQYDPRAYELMVEVWGLLGN